MFRSEIDRLADRRGVIVHYLPGPRRRDGSWQAQDARDDESSDAAALRLLAPEITDADIFVCGPPQWITAVRRAAMAAGAQRGDIHSEDFAW